MFAPTYPQPTQPMQPMMYNPNPNPSFPSVPTSQTFKIDDKDIPLVWGEQFKQVIDGFYQLEMDIHMRNMLYLLDLEQQRAKEVMQIAMTTDFTKKMWDTKAHQDQVEYIRDRCTKIQKRNTGILVKMMNLREKMVSQMYMYKVQSKSRGVELSQVSEKIRDLKYQISLKYNRLKVLKLNKELAETDDDKKQKESVAVNVPLVELRKGAELLER